MTIVVRLATPADLDVIVELNQVVQSVHAELYPDDFRPTVEPDGLKTLLAPRLANVALAEIDGVPAGYIWFEIQTRSANSFSPPLRRLFIHHLSVLRDFHRRGVASALMSHAEAFAEAEDIDEIALSHWVNNATARKFFAAQGFEPYQIYARKKLSR